MTTGVSILAGCLLAETAPAGGLALDSVLNVVNILATVALAVIVALWSRKDQQTDKLDHTRAVLGDTQSQVLISKIDALTAKVDAAITRHDADIDELHRKVNGMIERLVVLETEGKETRELRSALARLDRQLTDVYRRLDAAPRENPREKGGA